LLRGQVTNVDVLATRQAGVVTYGVTIAVEVPAGLVLREGLSVTTNIVVSRKEDVLLVPSRAISRQGANLVVTVLTPTGKQEQRVVRTGSTDGQVTEVVEGLQEGEQVVLGLRPLTSSTQGGPGPGQFFGGPGGGGGPIFRP
jgi:hypothetical protein